MEPARVRIDSHRLMRTASADPLTRITQQRDTTDERVRQRRVVVRERSKLHIFAFVVSFIFATGVATLGILTFVRSSENLVRLISTGMLSAASFVVVFAWIRTLVIERHTERYTVSEDGDAEHHKSKSVVYAFLALVVAILLAGLIMNTAFASPLSVR